MTFNEPARLRSQLSLTPWHADLTTVGNELTPAGHRSHSAVTPLPVKYCDSQTREKISAISWMDSWADRCLLRLPGQSEGCQESLFSRHLTAARRETSILFHPDLPRFTCWHGNRRKSKSTRCEIILLPWSGTLWLLFWGIFYCFSWRSRCSFTGESWATVGLCARIWKLIKMQLQFSHFGIDRWQMKVEIWINESSAWDNEAINSPCVIIMLCDTSGNAAQD